MRRLGHAGPRRFRHQPVFQRVRGQRRLSVTLGRSGAPDPIQLPPRRGEQLVPEPQRRQSRVPRAGLGQLDPGQPTTGLRGRLPRPGDARRPVGGPDPTRAPAGHRGHQPGPDLQRQPGHDHHHQRHVTVHPEHDLERPAGLPVPTVDSDRHPDPGPGVPDRLRRQRRTRPRRAPGHRRPPTLRTRPDVGPDRPRHPHPTGKSGSGQSPTPPVGFG